MCDPNKLYDEETVRFENMIRFGFLLVLVFWVACAVGFFVQYVHGIPSFVRFLLYFLAPTIYLLYIVTKGYKITNS